MKEKFDIDDLNWDIFPLGYKKEYSKGSFLFQQTDNKRSKYEIAVYINNDCKENFFNIELVSSIDFYIYYADNQSEYENYLNNFDLKSEKGTLFHETKYSMLQEFNSKVEYKKIMFSYGGDINTFNPKLFHYFSPEYKNEYFSQTDGIINNVYIAKKNIRFDFKKRILVKIIFHYN